MNEIPRLVVGHRARFYFTSGLVLEGKIIDAYVSMYLLIDVTSIGSNGSRPEKNQLINTTCKNFQYLEPLDTGCAEPVNEIPKRVNGKRVRLHFTEGCILEGTVKSILFNMVSLQQVKSIINRGERPEKDLYINNMCARFERLEILD